VRSFSSEKVRHLILRADSGDALPDALVRELRDQAVTCGWLRASGVLKDVELRAFRRDLGTLGPARRIEGLVHVLSLEGSVGLHAGDVSLGLRAVLARETDRGLETLAGELVSARVVALEAIVTALDELAVVRALDADAGVWLLGEAALTTAAAPAPPDKPRAPAPPEPPSPQVASAASAPALATPTAPAWSEAIAVAAPSDVAREAPARRNASLAGASSSSPAIPQRPVRLQRRSRATSSTTLRSAAAKC
jgi:predicted DNA-binding protein with PD1-like motif